MTIDPPNDRQELFRHGEIIVDARFARFGGKSFAIDKINSIEVRSNTTPDKRRHVLLWVLAGAVAVIAVVSTQPILFVGAVVLAIAGYSSWRGPREATTHELYLMTSSSETQALKTDDQGLITKLRDAIEGAMARSR